MVARRATRLVAATVLVLAFVAGTSASPAGASGTGGGFMDATFVYTPAGGGSSLVTYPAMYFYGQLDVPGQSYTGGFYVTGMTAVSQPGGGQCFPPACDPIGGTGWVGRDPGTVHGMDPNYGAVTGQCAIQLQADYATGPFFLVPLHRTIGIVCTVSVLGTPATFSLNVTSVTDRVGNLVGVYTVA